MNYLLVKVTRANGICWLGNLKNVPDPFELRFGISRAVDFPDDAELRMDPDFPKDIGLADVLKSGGALLVVSDSVRSFLESVPGALFQNELLPVHIVNHKGRRERARYFIVNQLDHPPCLKEDECVGQRQPINPEQFQFIQKMVLDESRIGTELQLFRAAQYPELPLVRRDLAEKLRGEGFTGVSFHEVDGFDFS
jgi:hypothetical protein